MTTGANIFANYLAYTAETEPPVVYHRWCYLSALGAVIARKAWLEPGHQRIFPTLYTMCIGEPATRKSTAIKIVKRLLAASGYDTFAADTTKKEKFLLDLEGILDDTEQLQQTKGKYDAVTAENLWGKTEGEPREVFIVADEFNDFAGTGDLGFFTTLGNLWDWDDPNLPFTQRFKNSKSVSIYQPTVSILAGNTPELFSRCFPPEALGSGFLSRLLLIHGERSGRRITFPPPPDAVLGEALISYLRKLREFSPGKITLSPGALELLDNIYQEDVALPDIRFKAYSNRRFTQLQRICIILSTAKFQTQVTADDVIQANTILAHAEIGMPKAMGEFGKGKNSDVANKIMDIAERATKPVTNREFWQQVHKDLGSMKDLVDILQGLISADRLQIINGPHHAGGFLPKKAVRVDPKHVDWSFLTQEERDMI
jgi:Protein of unknown function (DUF3987)